jgi:hypothetical protein
MDEGVLVQGTRENLGGHLAVKSGVLVTHTGRISVKAS